MTDKEALYEWCRIPAAELERHPDRKIPFRLVRDSAEMGSLMARELAEDIRAASQKGMKYRAIIPCGPKCWYEPFAQYVNSHAISLQNVEVFHMDECLDWQGNLLAEHDPYNFCTFMKTYFYGPILPELNVKEENRHFLRPDNIGEIRERIQEEPIDLTLGGWGQDGHVAYNQSRRHPFAHIGLDELRNSTVRIQENNLDTVIALAQRSYGGAYQFAPPMSVTLGMRECLSAKKVRLFSDTGTWKQTALRVALFSEPNAEYPVTLLQEHPDALLTATLDTASHPISEHPEWEFKDVNV